MGHCHCGPRHAKLRAGRPRTGLGLIAVRAAALMRTGLLIGNSVHESHQELKWSRVPMLPIFQMVGLDVHLEASIALLDLMPSK